MLIFGHFVHIDFFKNLYKHQKAEDQYRFLTQYMKIKEAAAIRRRPRKNVARSRLQVDYYLRKRNGTIVKVCAATFQSVTQFSRYRINGLAAHFQKSGSTISKMGNIIPIMQVFFLTGTARLERRGGKRISQRDVDVTESIIKHIQSLKCRSSHYGRNKSVRSYLPPELSVKKLYKMWKENRERVRARVASYAKYYKIFVTKFNLGFGNPRSDVCSFCELKCKEINKPGLERNEKRKLDIELKLHKLRAKRFYELLRQDEGEGVIKICFDMQQNQPLPKLSISDVYYMRQIWLYNLMIMVHASDGSQNKEDMFAYTWTENLSGKGSAEVASALLHFLENLEEKYTNPDFNGVKPHTLKLFSDSCSGQNKNSTVMIVLLYFVQKSTIFDKILHIFPIRGHSYMPPDRVFGRIEKDLRKQEKIVSPEEYYTTFEKYCTVKDLKRGDWAVRDYKSVAKQLVKPRFDFKTTQQRIFIYTKGKHTLQVQNTYSGASCSHSILKKNKQLQNTVGSTPLAEAKNCIAPPKRQNVLHLIKHLGTTDKKIVIFVQ